MLSNHKHRKKYISIVLFFALYIFAYTIPNDRVIEPTSAYFTNNSMIESGPFYDYADQWTECDTIVLSKHISLRGSLTGSDAKIYNGCEGFIKAYNNGSLEMAPPNTYFRFWHGSQIIYKPLYSFFGLKDARTFFGTLSLITLLLFTYQLSKKSKVGAIFFLLSLIPSSFLTIFSNTSSASTLFIFSLIGASVLIFSKSEISRRELKTQNKILFFSGVIYTYWDFLIVPFAVWSLVWFLVRTTSNKKESIKDSIHSSYFLFGVAITYILKWLLALIDPKNNGVIENILNGFLFRVGNVVDGTSYTKLELVRMSIVKWLEVYPHAKSLLIFTLILWCSTLVKPKISRLQIFVRTISFIAPIFMGTYFLASHSYIHSPIFVSINWVVACAIINYLSIVEILKNFEQNRPQIQKKHEYP